MIQLYVNIFEGKLLEEDLLERQVYIDGKEANFSFKGKIWLEGNLARIPQGIDTIDVVIAGEYTPESLEAHKGYKHAMSQKRKVYPRTERSREWLNGFATGWNQKALFN